MAGGISPKKKSAMRNYNPTSGELCEKLEAIVQEAPDADSKAIYATLLQQEAKWKVPERRVAKFVKRIKAGNNDDDDHMSVSSTGTMQSIRKYFAERKAKKAAKRSARKQAKNNNLDSNDDDDLSSVSSMSSVRKFFRRNTKNTKSNNSQQRTPTKSINVPANGKDQALISPLKGMFSPEMAAAQQTPARNNDDDDDNGSVSSLNALSGRKKGRKSSLRKKKKAASPPTLPVPPSLATDSTPKLLQPLAHDNDDEEPDLIKDVPTYDSYLDEMEHNKLANGKALNDPASYSTTSRQLVYLDQPAEHEATGLCTADGCTSFWNKFNPWIKQHPQPQY